MPGIYKRQRRVHIQNCVHRHSKCGHGSVLRKHNMLYWQKMGNSEVYLLDSILKSGPETNTWRLPQKTPGEREPSGCRTQVVLHR